MAVRLGRGYPNRPIIVRNPQPAAAADDPTTWAADGPPGPKWHTGQPRRRWRADPDRPKWNAGRVRGG